MYLRTDKQKNKPNCFSFRDYDILNYNISQEGDWTLRIETDLFEFAWFGNKMTSFNDYIQELSEKALPEYWGKDNKILKNYLSFTFKYLARANNASDTLNEDIKYFSVSNDNKAICFNTGLYSEYYAPIYAFFKINQVKTENSPKWFFIGFKEPSDIELNSFSHLPLRMKYVDDTSDLVFDSRLEVRMNLPHILSDQRNVERLPEDWRELSKIQKVQRLEGAVNIAKKKVEANYTLAVPQYYRNSLQLLLPISLQDENKVDLGLAISKENGIYSGRTCLTYDMAYNNARLIARPDSSWLKPEKIDNAG